MTVTSLIPSLTRPTLLCLVLAVGVTGCASGHRPRVSAERQECLSDEGTVRACLVPEPGNGNIKIGDTGCYWFALEGAKEEERKQFSRQASGRPRQFSFHVVNKCQAKVEVRFDLATKGSLEFLTRACEVQTDSRQQDSYLELLKGWIDVGASAGVQCNSLPYRKKRTGKVLTRGFRLVATGYDNQSIPPVEFDPEVVLEKAGDP